ncbi:hypothetical protein OG21DRAFT_1523435 [Imleria badia]|nr:hypothetical protein OG21DRAFT_1527374 [Imleria badia]KAF8553001.1 hypothetical protein OG21DRAFT_1523435 [Imleria badia]
MRSPMIGRNHDMLVLERTKANWYEEKRVVPDSSGQQATTPSRKNDRFALDGLSRATGARISHAGECQVGHGGDASSYHIDARRSSGPYERAAGTVGCEPKVLSAGPGDTRRRANNKFLRHTREGIAEVDLPLPPPQHTVKLLPQQPYSHFWSRLTLLPTPLSGIRTPQSKVETVSHLPNTAPRPPMTSLVTTTNGSTSLLSSLDPFAGIIMAIANYHYL